MTSHATYPDLKGASVFITGGGSGIGAALTKGFLRQGAKVAFVQRSDAAEFCDAMEQKTGNRPLFIRCRPGRGSYSGKRSGNSHSDLMSPRTLAE